MGGSYGGSYRSSCSSSVPVCNWKKLLTEALKTPNGQSLGGAYRAYLAENSSPSGFIREVARALGIQKNEDIPKEFPDIEYEVKFDITVNSGRDSEPGLVEILDAFDFPPGARGTRFLKDPVNTVATGINRFYGTKEEERLVVIEKGGGLYLKEKSEPIPFDAGIPFQQLVIKRTEERYVAEPQEVLDKIDEVTREPNVIFRGKIRKEKGDAFILDTSDGRLYSFTITRAHLIRPGEIQETAIQRQLEIEYAGHMPSFPDFEKDSEKQLISGMVDLARYVGVLYGSTPLPNGWSMSLHPTSERKHDFVSGGQRGALSAIEPRLDSLDGLLLIGAAPRRGN